MKKKEQIEKKLKQKLREFELIDSDIKYKQQFMGTIGERRKLLVKKTLCAGEYKALLWVLGKRWIILLSFSLFFIGCNSNKLILTDCQRKNCAGVFQNYNRMEVGKIYKVSLCDEIFNYSFDGKHYILKKTNEKTEHIRVYEVKKD